MKRLVSYLILAVLPQIALSGEIYVFGTIQKIPDGCVHYASPNRYVCREIFAQVEFHNLAYVNTLFQLYQQTTDTNIVYKTQEDDFSHRYIEKRDENGLLRIYALCKEEKCVTVATDNEQSILQWLTPHSANLLVPGNK